MQRKKRKHVRPRKNNGVLIAGIIIGIIIITFLFFSITTLSNAQQDQSIYKVLSDILKILGGSNSSDTASICENLKKSGADQATIDKTIKENKIVCPSPGAGNPGGNGGTGGGALPVFSDYGLPQPSDVTKDVQNEKTGSMVSVRGYKDFLNDLKSLDDNGRWRAVSLLQSEKAVSMTGKFNVKRYLVTAWVWLDAALDPYEVNCHDSGSESDVNVYCTHGFAELMQVGGYQAFDRKNDFATVFNNLYQADNLHGVMNDVLANSDRASRAKWSYKSGQSGSLVNKYTTFLTVPTDLSINDISPNSGGVDGNEKTQYFTLILGKDPNMVIALNTFAVGDGFVSALKSDTCLYNSRSYCSDFKQKLSNMVAALWAYDNDRTDISQANITTTPPPQNANRREKFAYWAEQIRPNITGGTACGMLCRNVTITTNGGINSTSRAGSDDGVGPTGRYWCTTIVKDALALADGVANDLSESVISMMSQWQSKGWPYFKYYALDDRKSVITQIGRGCAMFQFSTNPPSHNGSEHVSVVTDITLDANGDGVLYTVESDAPKTTKQYVITGWTVKNLYYPYLSFGCL